MFAQKTSTHFFTIPGYITCLLLLAIIITSLTIWTNHPETEDESETTHQSLLIQDEMTFNLVAIGLILLMITITGFRSGDGYLSKPSKKTTLYSLQELKKTQRWYSSRPHRQGKNQSMGPGQSAA